MKTEALLQNIRTMRVNMMAKQNPSLKRLNLLEIMFKNWTGASRRVTWFLKNLFIYFLEASYFTILYWFYYDGEAPGYRMGSAKGVINFAAELGLGEATDQVLKSPQRKAGSNYTAFLDEEWYVLPLNIKGIQSFLFFCFSISVNC